LKMHFMLANPILPVMACSPCNSSSQSGIWDHSPIASGNMSEGQTCRIRPSGRVQHSVPCRALRESLVHSQVQDSLA
jgi:hypothetical protein